MKTILALLSFCLPVLVADGQEINGQVFIATKGGENIKLALVPVGLYPATEIRDFIAEKDSANKDRLPKVEAIYKEAQRVAKQATEVEHDAWETYLHSSSNDALTSNYHRAEEAKSAAQKVESQWARVTYYLKSALYYFESLPSASVATKTDADGKFALSAPSKGDWILAAYGTRRAGTSQEYYYWLVKVRVADGKTSVMLANDNLIDSGSAESLIKAYCEDEFAAAGEKLIPAIPEFIAKAEQKAKAEELAAAARADEERKAAASLVEKERLARMPGLVKESQARALKAHPDLGTAGSALNKKFVDRYKTLQAEKSPRLQEPDWPEKLADECSDPNEHVANR